MTNSTICKSLEVNRKNELEIKRMYSKWSLFPDCTTRRNWRSIMRINSILIRLLMNTTKTIPIRFIRTTLFNDSKIRTRDIWLIRVIWREWIIVMISSRVYWSSKGRMHSRVGIRQCRHTKSITRMYSREF